MTGGPGSEVVVSPVGPDDWAAWSALRLRALRTDPDAFGAALEREEGYTEDDWREALGTLDARVARVGGTPVGLGASYDDGPGHAAVVAMWVAPQARGHGLGTRILAEVLAPLTARGLTVRLWVAEANPARRVYARAGFVDTGEVAPIRPGATLTKSRMVLLTRSEPAPGQRPVPPRA